MYGEIYHHVSRRRETDREKRGAENLEQEAGLYMGCSSNSYGQGSLRKLSGH